VDIQQDVERVTLNNSFLASLASPRRFQKKSLDGFGPTI